VPICKSFLVTEAERKNVGRSARFQQHRDASYQVPPHLQGKAPKEIHAILTETIGKHAPSYATVKNWVAQFKHSDFSTCDAPRPGRPKTVTTTEITDQIHELICGNKLPTRCNRGFYCRFYCLLNMFRAPLCPSSGALEYYTVVAACGVSCCGFQVAGLVWS